MILAGFNKHCSHNSSVNIPLLIKFPNALEIASKIVVCLINEKLKNNSNFSVIKGRRKKGQRGEFSPSFSKAVKKYFLA